MWLCVIMAIRWSGSRHDIVDANITFGLCMYVLEICNRHLGLFLLVFNLKSKIKLNVERQGNAV